MTEREMGLVLSRMVKIGIVSDVKGSKVRVYYEGQKLTSGWLPVLKNTYKIKYTDTYIADTSTGGGAKTRDEREVETTLVMPKVNDKVVVLYLPFADSDGFVIGGL